MSIFGTIMNKIFHRGQDQGGQQPQQQQQQQPQAAPAQPQAQPQAPQQAQQPVDVEAVLSQKAQEKAAPSDWRHSIVDLLKLLDMDSSLQARKELANELNVHVAADGSAEQNIALHRAVMQKLAENGGKVPADLQQ